MMYVATMAGMAAGILSDPATWVMLALCAYCGWVGARWAAAGVWLLFSVGIAMIALSWRIDAGLGAALPLHYAINFAARGALCAAAYAAGALTRRPIARLTARR